MPLRNILAISLALALGQAAWAQTPTGHPEVQYKDAPDFGYPTTGGGVLKPNCTGPYEKYKGKVLKYYVKVDGELKEREFDTEKGATDFMEKNCRL